MNKIVKLSRFFKRIFQVIFYGWPIMLAIIWFQSGAVADTLSQIGLNIANFVPGYMNMPIFLPLSMEIKMCGFVASFIPAAVGMGIAFCFIRLFEAYQQGEVFATKSIRYLKKIGAIMLLWALLNPLYQALISLIITWNNPIGQHTILISVGAHYFSNLITAGLVFLIAYIMQEGVNLREEQALTV